MQEDKQLLNAQIKRMPIDLLIYNIADDNDMSLALNVTDFDLEPYSDFIPGLEGIKGSMNSNLWLRGSYPKNLEYGGVINVPQVGFTIAATNMPYYANLDVEISQNQLNLKELKLSNRSKNKNGRLQITGKCLVNNDYSIKDVDIAIKAKKFGVLSEETKAVMPKLYGDLMFSTVKDIKITGNLDQPSIEGGIALYNSKMKMSLSDSKRKVESELQYVIKETNDAVNISFADEVSKIDTNKVETIPMKINKSKALENDFFKKLALSISFYIDGLSSLTLDLGPIGEMYAEITDSDNNQPIVFNKNHNKDLGQIAGRLTLSNKSTLKTIKLFNLSGFVDFPTNSPLEPALNVMAIYDGILTDGSSKKNYQVVIELNGPIDNLKNEIYYTLQKQKAVGDKAAVQQEALMLLLTGQLTSSMAGDGSEDDNANNILQSSTSALLSTFASKSLNGMLSSNYINSAAIDLKGESFEEATIKLSGKLPGDITWTFGSDITDINGAKEISIELPIYTLIENENLRNIFLEGSWNESSQNTEMDEEDTDWEVKFKFNKAW